MPTDNPNRNPSDRMDLPFVGLATFARNPHARTGTGSTGCRLGIPARVE
jgi:hypothetical protein